MARVNRSRMSFADKTAIVTGGASGIGLAIAKALADRGAIVVVADIDATRANDAAEEIVAKGGRAEAAAMDVSDAAAVQKLVTDTVARHGRLDYMFNNAGISMMCEMRDMSLADWDRIVTINLWGVIHGVQAAYAQMLQQGHGHIVNTGSITGLAPFPLTVAYNTTKYAVVGLSTSLRIEAADLGVKVSVACPGFIDTPLKDKLTYRNMDKEASIKALPFKLHSAEACAADILRGVVRNRALILTPLHARMLSWLYRLAPWLFGWANTMVARKSRDFRTPLQQRTQPDGGRHTFDSIALADPATIIELFRRGTAPSLRDLEGWQYNGRNLSLVSRFLRIRRFIKGFAINRDGGDPKVIDGYNLWARQNNGLEVPWEPSSPNPHGFYKVYRVKPDEPDKKHPQALMLNYGLGKNPWHHPSRFLRDYLVQVYPDDPGLLIGNAYFALGPFRIFGGYFVMQRREKRP